MVHILSIFSPFPGHIRPHLGFITSLLEKDPDVIYTIIAYLSHIQLITQDLDSLTLGPDRRSRLRVVGVCMTDPGPGPEGIVIALDAMTKEAPPVYQDIFNGREVTCAATGTTFSSVLTPHVVIVDAVVPYIARAVKDMTPEVELLVLWIASAGAFTAGCGPLKWGGNYNWLKRTEEAVKLKPTNSFEDAALEVQCDFSGTLKTTADGLSYYDYELHPQDQPPNPLVRHAMDSTSLPTEPRAAGVIIASSETFEPGTTELVLRQWYEKELGKKAYFVGPGAVHLFRQPSDAPREPYFESIFQFLDRQASRSVWVISFGTLYYPFMHPDHVIIILKVLMEQNVPFIICRSASLSALAPIPEDLQSLLKGTQAGLIVDFMPQADVLRHPNVRVFLTHGGINSMFECVVCGGGNAMPVFWPMAIDQPLNALTMTQGKDCAFELVQIRTGQGKRRPYYGSPVVGTEDAIQDEVRQILADLQGDVGQRKLSKLKDVHAELTSSVAPGGDVDRNLKRLLVAARGG